MTRKLTIRTKLAAALAVPLVALAAFAALQVRGAYDRADQVKRQAALAISATGPAGLLAALESERDYQSLWAIGDQDLVDPQLQTSGDATSRTNQALLKFREQVLERGGDTSGNYTTTLANMSGRLSQLRKDAQAHASKTATPAAAKHANDIFDRYTALEGQLLDADERSGHTIDDAQLRNGAELLNAIARLNDVEKQIAVKGILATVSQDAATASQVERLAGVQAAGDAGLRVRGDGAYGRAIISTLTAKDRATVVTKLQAVASDPMHVNINELFKTATSATNLWRVPQTNTTNVVTERAQVLTSDAQAEQRNWVIVTIASVLLAIAMLWLANKWITRPLRSLAEQASTMAGDRLPAAVKEILAARRSEDVVHPDVDPVRVRAGGEVREVAAALNRVQDSAIGLAVEQARLRGNVADAFVNLGRRNQNLLSRQLEFITNLENDESNPETLEHLFKLDHLATRMRRNAESLLVLAGHEPPRTWSGPVEIGDVVRGALGEVEGYQRVRLRHLDDARVDGAVAVDVSHVVAELVENALTFSPPDTDVEVYGRRDEFGYLLTIVDQGIGIPADELERANALISSPDTGTFAASRFLGHYVVAQLAGAPRPRRASRGVAGGRDHCDGRPTRRAARRAAATRDGAARARRRRARTRTARARAAPAGVAAGSSGAHLGAPRAFASEGRVRRAARGCVPAPLRPPSPSRAPRLLPPRAFPRPCRRRPPPHRSRKCRRPSRRCRPFRPSRRSRASVSARSPTSARRHRRRPGHHRHRHRHRSRLRTSRCRHPSSPTSRPSGSPTERPCSPRFPTRSTRWPQRVRARPRRRTSRRTCCRRNCPSAAGARRVSARRGRARSPRTRWSATRPAAAAAPADADASRPRRGTTRDARRAGRRAALPARRSGAPGAPLGRARRREQRSSRAGTGGGEH